MQVTLHAPPPQETDDPAPTVCVQDWPLQTIWQLSPQAPEQLASALQVSLQLWVDESQASN
ncbi:MAG: hypothetical protein IT431_07205 [Phycisphaerales bacterium]|nr:hypothetical protein [Phycisphaerales bacterium]